MQMQGPADNKDRYLKNDLKSKLVFRKTCKMLSRLRGNSKGHPERTCSFFHISFSLSRWHILFLNILCTEMHEILLITSSRISQFYYHKIHVILIKDEFFKKHMIILFSVILSQKKQSPPCTIITIIFRLTNPCCCCC